MALKRVDLSDRCGHAELAALELLKEVRHPHLLSIHGYWVKENLLVIGFELADESLLALLKRDSGEPMRGLPPERVIPYLTDAAEALDFLGRPIHRLNHHAVRIQHRDVKPSNLLLQGGAVKVGDFGLAKNSDHRWAGCVKFIGEVTRANDPSVVRGTDKVVVKTQDISEAPIKFRGRPVTTGLLLVGEDLVPLPLKRTDVHGAITAAAAEVTVTQVFANTHDRPLEATYVFPLPEDAAVHRLRMHVGDRVIEGLVREKEEARQTYEEAKREGHGAALVEETTPNIFTSSVANILPGQEIRVEIAYLQTLPFQEGQYRFVFPMVVSPRYVLGADETAESIVPNVPSAVLVPRLPQGMLRGDTVSLQIDLDAGVPLCGFDSPSHDVVVLEETGTSRVKISLRNDREIPNRDFVLNYRVAGPRIEHALLCEPGKGDEPGTFVLLATPPAGDYEKALPREIIFVLDRSGSMQGQPMEQAKQAARQLLDRLEPEDVFNVIAFDNEVTPLASAPLPAEEANLRRARAFLEKLEARGGTEMLEPLRMALSQPRMDDVERVRMVVFLTDGSVYGERELLAALRPVFDQADAVGKALLSQTSRDEAGMVCIIFDVQNRFWLVAHLATSSSFRESVLCGRVKQKVEPRPTPSDSIQMRPP